MKSRILLLIIGSLLLTSCATHRPSFGETPRQKAASAVSLVLYGPPVLLEHAFWTVWGQWSVLTGLIAGKEKQVANWHPIQVGPTYGSTKLFGHWAYYGHEAEKRVVGMDMPAGSYLRKAVPLMSVEHERDAWVCCRTNTAPSWNMVGAETRPLEPHGGY